MNKTLFLMVGFPGAGKTTAAKFIKQFTGAEHLWADHERRHMFNKPTYSHQENLELYEQLNKVAEQMLAAGKSVIFDTNFNFYKDREHLRKIATKHDADTVVVWVQTKKETAKQRAVEDAHLHTHTRVLGHMPEDHFERIAGNLEPPLPNEVQIVLDGTKITHDYIAKELQKVNIL